MSLASSWLAFEGADFSGRLYVLEEGSYPDLKAMGCVHGASIRSLQTVGFVGAFKYCLSVAKLSSLLMSNRLGSSRSSLCPPSLCLSAAACGARGWS